jgi:hypothetical protein
MHVRIPACTGPDDLQNERVFLAFIYHDFYLVVSPMLCEAIILQ